MDIRWVWESQNLTQRTLEHLRMFGIALALSIVIGVLLGLYLYRRPKLAPIAFNVLNILETVPTLALLVLLLPVLGLGEKPTIAASVIYSILPIARNTYTGLTSVERSYIEVAEAIGLSEREVLLKVRFPLALPLIAAGIRIAVVFYHGRRYTRRPYSGRRPWGADTDGHTPLRQGHNRRHRSVGWASGINTRWSCCINRTLSEGSLW